MVVRAAGTSWFREEDYPQILKIMVDAHVLPKTYEQWRLKAEGQERKVKATGLTIFRVFIDPETFPTWCRKNGLNVDAKARTAFAAEGAMEQVKRTH